MKKRYKWTAIITLIVLFAGMNLYLIKEDSELVDRTSLVYDQKRSKTETVENLLIKNGVTQPAEEQRVYFSEQLGMFTRFLVDTGDRVSPGTPLYEYTVSDLEEQRLIFESEIEQLDREASSIDSYISDLEAIERQLREVSNSSSATARPSSRLNDEELLITIELEVGIDVSDATLDQTRAIIDQKISEQEALINRLEAESAKYQRLADGLEDSPVVTVESEYTGQVARLSEDISSPLITIYPDSLASRVQLTDDEALLVSEGMNARITSPVTAGKTEGSVVSNPRLPETEPELNDKSYYPAEISLPNVDERWFTGQHVVNEIILESSEGITVPLTSLNDSYVHVLAQDGLLYATPVERGILDGDRQQVLGDLTAGEWILADPDQAQRFYQPYITPMTFERMNLDNLTYTDSRTNWKYFLLGLVPN
ncbi:efflux RND transporter periplasmic adaptor subunit [Jeotgalibacillus sp. R-1-5s-1]|uniref:efflux RND transporter periplasmic adaptor subunit n=1 Tax=Jeotgalibacillus sp. R-1-5s-1 TaxID=2555897 RepID=UPI001068F276|nr:efflux RND transporter periplasmic adaptor subunit [Jeotgalibacillus sp. R-1-5s-1]TFD97025.1 hypothetical protein E2491_10030 [Jeotgalibacillus sp. R-1-5s-1]